MSVPLDAIAQASVAALADFDAPATPPVAEQGPAVQSNSAADQAEVTPPALPAEEAEAQAAESTTAQTPVAEPEATEQPTTQTEAEQPAMKWVLKHKGKTVEVTSAEELRTLAQKGFDYTQGKQQIADRERQLLQLQESILAQRESEKAAIRQLLSNKETLKAVLSELERTEVTPDSTELTTVAQVQSIARRELQAAQQAQREQAARAAQIITKNQFEAKKNEYSTQVDSTLEAVIKEHAILADTDGVEVLLLNDIAPQLMERIQADPNTEVPFDDVAKMLRESAQRRADKEKARLDNHTKTAVARAAIKPKVQPAPPGGTTVNSSAEAPKNFKFGDRALTQAAIADYERIVASKRGNK